MQANEHALVLKALDPIAANRKCFRLIGGVLVEQNVGLVKPSVQNKSENLKKVVFSRHHIHVFPLRSNMQQPYGYLNQRMLQLGWTSRNDSTGAFKRLFYRQLWLLIYCMCPSIGCAGKTA